ncbi:MAG: metal-dependent transcriptional regulator, partial [Saprospiraceae bacterium]
RVNTNAIAAITKTSAASVTDMVKRLAEKELVLYEKYKGVTLTKNGGQIATSLIRKHRLWEYFLVQKLNFSWADVHDIAEELEHVSSLALIKRLDDYLGNPKFDPHGDPIPNAEGKFTIRAQQSLDVFEVGTKGILLGVKEHHKDFLEYLNKIKIALGSELEILEKNNFDNSIIVKINNNKTYLLTEKVSKNLLIKK